MSNAGISSFQQLNGKKRQAVELKYEGVSHKAIADKLGLSLSTIDHYFERNGQLYEAYTEYANYMSNNAVKEAQDLIRKHRPEAIETLMELSRKPYAPSIRVQAARAVSYGIIRAPELTKLKPEPSELQKFLDEENAQIARQLLNDLNHE